VLCASYSGDTEETVSCFEAAGELGAARAVVTTGGELAQRARSEAVPVIGVPSGMRPRAAVAYMTVAALECAAACGAAPARRAARRDAGRAGPVARAARRSRLDLPLRAARSRPEPDGADRAAEGASALVLHAKVEAPTKPSGEPI